MRGWIILIVTLLVGAALGVAGTVYVPPRVDPYLPNPLRLKSRVVEGQVVQKQRDGNRVLVKVQTDQGMILATFSKRAAEVDLGDPLRERREDHALIGLDLHQHAITVALLL